MTGNTAKLGLGMRFLSNMLERFIKRGTLRVFDADGRMIEFVGSAEPVATIRLHDPSLPMKLFNATTPSSAMNIRSPGRTW